MACLFLTYVTGSVLFVTHPAEVSQHIILITLAICIAKILADSRGCFMK